MAMDFTKHSEFFDRYAPQFTSVVMPEIDILQKLCLVQQGSLTIAYAPFDYVPRHAELVIIGITPGRTQAIKAIAASSASLLSGRSDAEASRLAKLTGSFSGPMRTNLVSMLDYIGVAWLLGISTSATLFDPACERVHFTSALRYPVFVQDQNFLFF